MVRFRLLAAVCAAFFLALLGNSQSFAITLSVQGGAGGTGMTCNPPGGYSGTGSGSVVCSQSGDFAATGDASSVASAGHVGATAHVATIGTSAGDNMTGTAIYSDFFVFHSSTLSTTMVSLNLNAIGTMAVGGDLASANVDMQVTISSTLAGEIRSSIDTSGSPTCSSTFFSGGCTGVIFSGGGVTTKSVLVGIETPVFVQLRLDAFVTATHSGSSSSSEFSNSLDFLIGVPLFNLEDGVTVDAATSFVADNIFAPPTSATPIPAALPLFATGLGALGLLGWRRKQKQAV